MKILERRILHDPGTAFSHIRYGQFSRPCHAHVEFELMYITSGRGLQFAGDGVEPYRAGDLALLGSGLPHFHLCDRVRLGGDGEASSGEVLQFPPDLFPQNMERLGDYAEIRRLLECSRRGIRFGDRVLAAEVGRLIRSVDALSGTERLVRLYEILGRLARSADYRLISPAECVCRASWCPGSPMYAVEGYLAAHFRERVSLSALAAAAGRNPAALCRYFRERTGKTPFEYLAEMRIGLAVRLLKHSDLTCSQIAYESGFNSYALFVRQFRRITGRTPDRYRREISLEVGYSRTL